MDLYPYFDPLDCAQQLLIVLAQREAGNMRRETWDVRQKTWDMRQEMWDRRCETEDVRQER